MSTPSASGSNFQIGDIVTPAIGRRDVRLRNQPSAWVSDWTDYPKFEFGSVGIIIGISVDNDGLDNLILKIFSIDAVGWTDTWNVQLL